MSETGDQTVDAVQAAAGGQATRAVSGRVVSNKMDKTVTVSIERQLRHPIYGKFISRRTKVHAHDEKNECRQGDLVLLQECRPISRTKSWRLMKILERAPEI
jgi:small subunit ribosomal protein S17